MPTVVVADDELEIEEVQEWINAAGINPKPQLVFAKDKNSLFDHLETIKKSVPAKCIVFLDLNLKGRKFGIEALKKIKNDNRLKILPVVIYSQSSDPKDIEETGDLNANSYLTKGNGATQGERFGQALAYWVKHDHFSS